MKSIRFFCFIVVMLVSFAQTAAAATTMKIAVIDSDMAVLESDAAKQYAKMAESKFAPQIKQIKTLGDELKKMEQKLQKEGPTLSAAQRETRQLDIKRKYEDLQLKDRQLRVEKARSDQEELGKLRPRLEQAIEQISKEQGYDLVLQRGAVAFVKPEFDITRMVIERLNKTRNTRNKG